MAAFKVALINEIEKLYKKKKALVAVLLSLLVIVLGQLIMVGVRSGFGVRGVGSVEFATLVLSVVINTVLPLFTALVAIDSFSGEFSNNMIRTMLTRPVSRLKIFSAKITAIALFILTNLCLLLVFSLAAGFLFNAHTGTPAVMLKTVCAYLASLLPLLILALAIVLLANIFKSGTSVFFISTLGFIVMKVLGMFFIQYASFLPTTYLDWYALWIAHDLPLGKIVRQLLIMIGCGIMLFTAGFYFFDKKEF